MKKKVALCIIFSIIMCMLSLNNVSASALQSDDNSNSNIYIEYLDDGSYIITETNIENAILQLKSDRATTSTTTASSISTYYSSSNVALCALKITGTFSYDGNTVSCTSKKSTKYSYNSAWTVENVTTGSGQNSNSTKSYARADGEFVHRLLGIVTNRIATTAIVYCDKNGSIS